MGQRQLVKDLAGQKFGRLTALSYCKKHGRSAWLCRCICGNEKVILTFSLTGNQTKSCGCLVVEVSALNMAKNRRVLPAVTIESRQKAIKKYNDSHKKEAHLYYLKNREKKLNYSKEYNKNNREKINKYTRERRKDPKVKLRHTISCHIRHAIKGTKMKSCMAFLPFSIEELKLHLESQFEMWMNWDNWGIYDSQIWDDDDSSTWSWQIDHIIPQMELPYDSMSHSNFIKCWDLSNLRPLAAKANIMIGSQLKRKL